MSTLLSIVHPFTVHLHVAFFTLSFFLMYYWLIRGLTSGIFDNRVRDVGHLATQLGVVFLVLAMLAGLHDAFLGPQHFLRVPILRRWLDVKITLATLTFITYAAFLRLSARRRKYLQEDGRLLLGCLVTQALGYVLVGTITFIGTMLAYHPGFLMGHNG
jgi:uncharacterized membrane protein